MVIPSPSLPRDEDRPPPATDRPIALSSPPRVPLVLRVGVTGHRPDAAKRVPPDVVATRTMVDSLLAVISLAVEDVADHHGELFAGSHDGAAWIASRRVRIVSALAQGPDQWVAQEAVARGYELHCILPFDRREYRNDFLDAADAPSRSRNVNDAPQTAGDSAAADYAQLLGLASAVFELDGRVTRSATGTRQPDRRSYLAAGRAILRQSDLLVALWDGEPARGTGGTGQIVHEALDRGIPVVWIWWDQPGIWQLLLPAWRYGRHDARIESDPARLSRLVQELLLPPESSQAAHGAADLRRDYFAERQPRGNPLHACWELFSALVCARVGHPQVGIVDRFIRVVSVDRCDGPAPEDEARQFFPHYAWATGLSSYYGRLHRGAFVVTSLLGALAVFLALVTIAAGIVGRAQAPWIVAELVVILAIVGLTGAGRRRRWHQRWIDYRMLAERLRLARAMHLLGGGTPLVLHAGHLASYGNPLQTWMHWHALAVERAAGLRSATVSCEFLASCRQFWTERLAEDQRRYHAEIETTYATLDARLHRAGNTLFVLTLVACLLHLGHIWLESEPSVGTLPLWVAGWLTLLCGFLPAAGAACAAIRSQAETQRVAQRSRAMQAALVMLESDLAGAESIAGGLDFEHLRDCADRVSDLMIRETLDWRVVFQDRPLNLPV